MSGTSSVPKPVFGLTGFTSPLEIDILAGVKADLNAAFGGGLNPSLSPPQGQIAMSETAIIGDAYDQFCYYCTQVDPAYASGRMQDGIARIYFLTRNPATSTTIDVLCSGLIGVPIPVGALIISNDGTMYACVSGGSIVQGGIILPFAALKTGPISCPPHSVEIHKAISGWDSANNLLTGVLGNNVETREAFETRRSLSVAINAVGTMPAIRASVLAVPGVLDAYAIDNATNTTALIGGVVVPANSIFVSTAGGDPQAIAEAIWRKKAPGSPYVGTTTRTVVDSNSGYNFPFPAYTVKFTVATPVPIYVTVLLTNSPKIPSNYAQQIIDAVVAAFAGTDGGKRALIGSTIYASRFYHGFEKLGPWAEVIQATVATTPVPTLNLVSLNIDQVPTISTANIVVRLV